MRDNTMLKTSRIILCVLALAAISATAWPADQMVSVYVSGKRMSFDPAARVRNGVTYAPLRGAAQAVGAHVEWNAASQSATICLEDRCVPIKASQGIMVNNSMLIPVRLMSEAIGRQVNWDPGANAVRIK